MARPIKKGLSYFPLDVDIFEDDKLFFLQEKYGPLGETIYLRLLCLVYRNGYYYRFDSIDRLAKLVFRSVGNRWTKGLTTVTEVILFCAEINLFSSELMQQGVITSRSIQRRYLEARGRNRSTIDEYNLLENADIQEGLVSAPQKGIIAAETPVIAAKTPVIAAEIHTKEKETKENERKGNESKENESKENESKGNESKGNESRGKESGCAAFSPSPSPLTMEELNERFGENNVVVYVEKNRQWRRSHNMDGVNLREVERWLEQDGVKKPECISKPKKYGSFDMEAYMERVRQQYLD